MPMPPPRDMVYRVDNRELSDIFNHGFQPRGNNRNIADHISGRSCYGQDPRITRNTAYISTTGLLGAATRIGYSNGNTWERSHDGICPDMWVYQIRGTLNMYSAWAPIDYFLRSYPDEPTINFWAGRMANELETEEWIADGEIPATHIRAARRLSFPARGEIPVLEGEWVPNPNYIEVATQTSNVSLPITRTGNIPWYISVERQLHRVCTAFACGDDFPPTPYENRSSESYEMLTFNFFQD